MRAEVDLVVPVKTLDRAKSRLVGVGPARSALALAFALDTIGAALPAVRTVLAVTSDPAVVLELRALGVESVAGPEGLNEALGFGFDVLRGRDPDSVVGALQADLPALRTAELAAALAAARGRAFCPDRQGTGTTLLLSAPGEPLSPAFGVGSAEAHAASGATPLTGPWPSLRHDVDTAEDLALASTALGVGRRTAALLTPVCG
ncbi:2-phospho-L-lactate guanylyltransferase [Saccharothrix syringae]|uniref:Phosphoenolpyruvate guanylyltransferase n=1 Tax=Saccharothrix syringae TaxID=103733 RepID=A0A5Q0H9B9_SACSY|nr:2-phospho-L-lactate guanylyltransferase [Saccharothrix syringae]QFZ22828.1 2-phospho-L-lactate guanylyltransferase [Saccharothrix syringae]